MTTATLLIAHGSRLSAANDDLITLAGMLGERCPDEIIERAYLELAEPTIPQGMQACVKRGATRVRMLPYFLSAGAHVTHDLEEFAQKFRDEHSDVGVSLCPPIGLHPGIIDILLDRLEEESSNESVFGNDVAHISRSPKRQRGRFG